MKYKLVFLIIFYLIVQPNGSSLIIQILLVGQLIITKAQERI